LGAGQVQVGQEHVLEPLESRDVDERVNAGEVRGRVGQDVVDYPQRRAALEDADLQVLDVGLALELGQRRIPNGDVPEEKVGTEVIIVPVAGRRRGGTHGDDGNLPLEERVVFANRALELFVVAHRGVAVDEVRHGDQGE
jgi:hypothetical protein